MGIDYEEPDEQERTGQTPDQEPADIDGRTRVLQQDQRAGGGRAANQPYAERRSLFSSSRRLRSPRTPPPQFGAVPYARTVVGGGMACGAAEGMPAGGVEEGECSQPGDSRRGNTSRLQPDVPTGPGAELWASARTVAGRRIAGVHGNRMIRRYDSPIESRHRGYRVSGPHADALSRGPHAEQTDAPAALRESVKCADQMTSNTPRRIAKSNSMR